MLTTMAQPRIGNVALTGQIWRPLETFDLEGALSQAEKDKLRQKFSELQARVEAALSGPTKPEKTP